MGTDLLKYTENGGCSSKIPPDQLEEVLRQLPVPSDPDILVNIDTHDDAGVYRLSDDLALVLTTDFFPPVCSDPLEFGQIAAANSISDIYAMGARPILALNIIMFPSAELPVESYAEILKGGQEKADEAGVHIIGGHTIDDKVPKYGLAVVGTVNPAELVTNAGAEADQVLILTKPIGTGIILAGHRLGMIPDSELEEAKALMKLLNRSGADIMKKYGVKGATDITGFGLAGHALKMAKASSVTIRLQMKNVALIGSAYKLTDEGCIPSACFSNLSYAEPSVYFDGSLDYNMKMIAFDAQTSGGLLMSVARDKAEQVITDLFEAGLTSSAVVGEVLPRGEGPLLILE